MRTLLLAIGCAGAVGATAATAEAQAPAQPLSAPGFTTRFPAGWTHAKHKTKGLTLHTLMAPGTTMPNWLHSIPRSGGIAVTVSTVSAARRRRNTKRAAPKRGLAMLDHIGFPRGAKRIKAVSRGAIFKLDGVTGATMTLSYTYKGVENLQRDVAVRKGNRIVLIELNCRPGLESAGQAALNVVLAAWHWS
jgi:hypothetical protein